MPSKEWRYSHDFSMSVATDLHWELPGGPLPAELMTLLIERGVRTPESAASFLSIEHYAPALPSDLPYLDKAVKYFKRLVNQGNKHILVWGDFDVDGQTATALWVEGLRRLGLTVEYHIPSRQTDSHGVQLHRLKPLIQAVKPDLLLICDTGSTANDAVDYANTQGVPVIIADHHELLPDLPKAHALVNVHHLPREDHPLYTLSGVGVSYMVLKALYDALGRGSDASRFLDLVALGLVADVVPLIRDTRYLLQLGLRAAHQTQRVGLLALCEQLQILPSTLTSIDIGFRIAPPLNALGRLDDARKSVELLTTADRTTAQILAAQADGFNRQRRNLTRQTLEAAQEQIQADPSLLEWEALVLNHPNWHSGVIGIVASQLAEQYHKPVALLVSTDEGIARGSVRGAPGYSVSEALTRVADILENYGGHEGAGGLGIQAERLPMLRRRLSQAFAATKKTAPPPSLLIEGQLDWGQLTLDFGYQLQRLAPFGEGNPIPNFRSRDLALVSAAKLGADSQHRRLTIENRAGYRQTVLWWNSADLPLPEGRFDLAYTLDVTTYKGERQLQIVLEDWIQIEAPTLTLRLPPEILDCRAESPADVLARVRIDDPNAQVWAEGFPKSQSPGLPLSELLPAETLVILTVPPTPERLAEAMEKVQPRRVYWVAALPPLTTLSDYLDLLGKLAEVVMNQQDGQASVTQFVERLGQSPAVIRLGFEYLAASGKFGVQIGIRGKITLTATSQLSDDKVSLYQRLEQAWNESAAYRNYLRRVDPQSLL
ncbi:MAG: single-stranded-DNA-specific exonuclease RecJ [Anaerolineae bacterium]|nr:single-stranded-DNA-specific exonuclease RecJ [Anaerolineae bacterium]